MKAFKYALFILIFVGILIAVHSVLMINLADKISQNCDKASDFAKAEDWQKVIEEMDEIKKTWNKWRIWAALTISTEEIEQIEISLAQSRIYAQLHQKTDFFGEFTMFRMLIEHIPHQEGFHIAEIL